MRLFILCLLLACFCGCTRFRMNDKQTYRYFEAQSLRPNILRHQTAEGTIRYLEVGEHTENVVIFIHGAPSSMAIFRDLLVDKPLLQHTKIVAVDRAGYGYSDYGKAVVSIAEQARRLAPILQKYAQTHKRVILVGASYGGSVSAKLAMDYPDLVQDVMFVSASLAPREEKIYGISYMIRRRAFKWLFPKFIRVANAEKLAHEQALQEILPTWGNIKTRIHVLHGTADNLIYPANVAFAEKQLINAQSFQVQWIPDMGHKISYAHPEIIQKALLALLP
ncbi:MAG: alpha/beta hydrolase [Bacteroidetes bacterium]|nr:MAG: alpha/beta hydrolase [Bacteroidota bacterium]